MKINKCIVCSNKIIPFLNLGKQALANSFLDNKIDNEYKEDLIACFCESCKLVQLDTIIDKHRLFDDYIWVTGTSKTTHKHAKTFAEKLNDELVLQSNDLVLEVASNDGSYLRYFQELGLEVIGYDPAKNIAKIANDAGIKTIAEYFSLEALKDFSSVSSKKPKVIIARNVLTHTRDPLPLEMALAVKSILAKDGTFVIETPYLGNIIDQVQYDLFYHEHEVYFSVKSLSNLLNKAELSIVNVQPISGGPSGGGNILVYAMHTDATITRSKNVAKYLKHEEYELNKLDILKTFANKAYDLRDRLNTKILECYNNNKVIYGYGAAAKGNTILNFCNEALHKNLNDMILYIVDSSQMKQEKLTPGTQIRVVSPEYAQQVMPDIYLILAWNFANDIIRRETVFTDVGGKFIIANPYIPVDLDLECFVERF